MGEIISFLKHCLTCKINVIIYMTPQLDPQWITEVERLRNLGWGIALKFVTVLVVAADQKNLFYSALYACPKKRHSPSLQLLATYSNVMGEWKPFTVQLFLCKGWIWSVAFVNKPVVKPYIYISGQNTALPKGLVWFTYASNNWTQSNYNLNANI